MGISVNDNELIKLSESKRSQLGKYMGEFTRPLLQQVYGSADDNIENIDQIIDMFKSPDKKSAIENLKKLAKSLNMELEEIPEFLEEYGDIFLSLAYFKECLDRIIPNVS